MLPLKAVTEARQQKEKGTIFTGGTRIKRVLTECCSTYSEDSQFKWDWGN
jgi:hypothetical protein